MPRITVLIFAKYPFPGAVNTRMVPSLTIDQAAELHAACLQVVWERWGRLGGLDLKLLVTPDDRVDDTCRLLDAQLSDVWPQGDGELGSRLLRATDRAFTVGASGAILIGADSPTLPRSTLELAVSSLADHDAVLGPCEDGGYYLLGLRRRRPILFQGIDWGGPGVAAQTRQRAATVAMDLFELPIWYDLDRYEDLGRAGRDLARADDPSDPATGVLRRLLEAYACIESRR